ncbi:uncharacterized protein EDB91DRAFT_593106 [Suillus paluster]|uniref:uncharacterized protein n=1 Tax=Suillus paluster TaxID=48578 RepID=UPI001B866969|nr:uncharacterized protein EDB91DRAFT_593106 [Suillus paluster]KAG1734275.1 hypothetical protein EDB91DRAFT_593106 [Suillus paluster]
MFPPCYSVLCIIPSTPAAFKLLPILCTIPSTPASTAECCRLYYRVSTPFFRFHHLVVCFVTLCIELTSSDYWTKHRYPTTKLPSYSRQRTSIYQVSRLTTPQEANVTCMCRAALNVSHATWFSEDAAFIAHKKNLYEGLHRSEEHHESMQVDAMEEGEREPAAPLCKASRENVYFWNIVFYVLCDFSRHSYSSDSSAHVHRHLST